MRATTALLLTTLLLGGAVAAQEDYERKPPTKLYKWTDADGVVHYSATPVEEANVSVIEIRRGPKAPPVASAPVRAPLSCTQLRENVRLLEGDSQFLQVIEDGVPRRLTEEERLPQLEAAKAALEDCAESESAPAQ